MRARVDVITLGVDDLERSLAFYRALGLASPGVIGTEFVGADASPGGAAAMFELEGGLTLAVYGRKDLEQDANARFGAPGSVTVGQRDPHDAQVRAPATDSSVAANA
ncbi:MAG: hypothetical protein AUG91_07925 [Actinobacteria bacterium 13_1_20CM_4_69_9]|nr:MAG: hypothetical protein AUG91_07925 [Actinobacteria bacterium 13_1_20CM_4_69_9]